MIKYTKSSLPALLALSVACTALSACGTDDKPRIIVDNTDVPDNSDSGNNNGGDTNGDTTSAVAISALLNEVNYPKYEEGTHAVSQYDTYSCFTWQEESDEDFNANIENGTKRCGLIQYTITGDLTTLGKITEDKPVTVDYALTSTTGDVSTILKDPSMRTGTITLNKNNFQQILNFVLKTDGKKTGDWDVKLQLSNPTGGATLEGLNTAILTTTVIDVQSLDSSEDSDLIGTFNDTGVTFSGNMIKGNEVSCAVGVNGKQDCTNGRDALSDDDTNGVAGFSFIKLDSSGTPLAATADNWDCIKDEVTGNIWERKTYAAPIENTYGAEANVNKDFRDATWDYTFYNASNNLGSAGDDYSDTECKLGEGVVCNTANYIAKMNSEAVCGITDWHLPSRIDLVDIANLGGHEAYQTLHAEWLYTNNNANDDRAWKNYALPNQLWSSSVAAKYATHDGYSDPASLKFNYVWTMFSDGSLNREDPSSSYSKAAVLAVASQK